jgi:hypothetical protein
MAKADRKRKRKPSRSARRRKPAQSPVAVYLDESRDIGLSLLLVLPLLLAYEVTMLLSDTSVRNGAEVVIGRLLSQLPPWSFVALRRGLMLLLLVLAFTLTRAKPPRVARARWILLEAVGLALLLGPIVGWLVGGVGLSVEGDVTPAEPPVWLPFLLSVGAGLWEEILFRLALLGGVAFLLVKIFSVDRRAAVGIAIVVSALLFALYHHVGDLGEPLSVERFAFRAVAGTILGFLFATRGLAVVVYMHVFYDVLCDLRALHG